MNTFRSVQQKRCLHPLTTGGRAAGLLLVVFVFVLALAPQIGHPGPVAAAPLSSYAFTVTTTADTHDVNRGDGMCADKKGQCSLRAAIEEADALPVGSSITITVPAGTYALTLGALYLAAQRSITINGAGNTATIIKGNHTFRVLYIASPTTSASLSQLTIEGGSAPNNRYGGGIDNGGTLTVSNSTFSNNSAPGGSGGGIFNHGTLTVTQSTLSNNTAGGYGYGGGAIFNVGTLTVTQSTISGNSAYQGFGGGINNRGALTVSNSTLTGNSAYNGGGGINNQAGRLSVTHSTLSNNSAKGDGGGIESYSGTLTVSNSTLTGNSATYGWGGGIFNDRDTLTVSNSTFSNNTADGTYGGGIFNYNSGTLSVTTSTFSNNSANGSGGGIDNYYNGTLTVSNSTFSGNSVSYGGYGGGIDNSGSSTATLTGTIVANSTGGSNCAGPIMEGVGYNLDSDGSCGFHEKTDLNNTNPKLGPLQNNGGPTQTMALLQGSKAIDWVALSSCPSTDQRGYARPDGSGESACDIGAYESAY